MLLTSLLVALTGISVLRGVPATDAEVCRFEARDRENPFDRWLAATDVTCTPAGPIDFPPGRWNVFAETGDAISDPVFVEGENAPSSITFNLRPAATIEFRANPDQRVVAYVPRRAIAYALRDRLARVPAGEPLWLFVISAENVSAVLPVPAQTAARQTAIDVRSPAPWSVIGWTTVPESHRTAIEGARGLSPPRIQSISGAESREADALPDVAHINGAFFRVAGVPPGDVDIALTGRGWIRDQRRARVSSATTLVKEPLIARAAGTLIVRWSMPENIADLAASVGRCDRPAPPRGPDLTISACTPPERPRDEPTDCSALRVEPIDPEQEFGSARIDEVPPGFYRVEVRQDPLPPVSATTAVGPLQQREVSIQVVYELAYGTLTVGEEPLQDDAVLRFPGGYGFARKASGEYSAALLRLVGVDASVQVESCSEGGLRAVTLTDDEMRRHSRFNIDVPVNELRVVVTDTFTREPLRGARVRIDSLSLRVPKRVVLPRTVETTDAGTVVSRFLPERETVVSASLAGYEKSAVERFTMERSGDKRLEIQLVPLRGERGRIVSARPFGQTSIHWIAADGRETERAEVGADGTFVYASRHGSDESMIIVSASHGLWATRSPVLERRQTMIVRFPDTTPTRSFDVTNGSDAALSSLALSVGGIRVPGGLVRQHQTLHGMPYEIRPRRTIRIPNVVATGSISVFAGTPEIEYRVDPNGSAVVIRPQ